MRVQIDSERCQGHGRCYDLAPRLFGDDDEGYGKVLGDGVVPPGQEREAHLERRVVQHELQVERGQEEPGEHRRGPEDANDVGRRKVAPREETERHQRRADAGLDEDEDREECDRAAEETKRLRRRPAGSVAVDDRVDGEHQRGGDRHGASNIEPPVGMLRAPAREQPQREKDHDDADR